MVAGCINDRVMEKMLEEAVVVPVPVETGSSPTSFKGGSYIPTVEHFRERAEGAEPQTVHENWEIYRFDGLYYGRCTVPKPMEFIAKKMETPPARVVLTGHALLVLDAVATETGDGAVTTIEDAKFEVAGNSGTRNTVLIPMRSPDS